MLLRYSRRHSGRRLARSYGFIGKEVAAIEIVVHTPGNFGGFRAEGGTPAAQEDHNHNFSMIGVGKGSEPEKLDRKSTRLNSSHVSISYAVFCLKKKKKKK